MVEFAARRVEGLFTLFVDNLPTNMTNIWLRQLFMSCGEVVDAYVSKKCRRGVSGLFGFVRYRKEEEAKVAISKNNNLGVKGKKLWVQLSKFARSKEVIVGSKGRNWGSPFKDPGPRIKSQLGSSSSNNAVKSSDKGLIVAQERSKDEVVNDSFLGLCSNERTLVEGWVKLLALRDCVEEKVVVVVGDKTMVVHGVLLEPSNDLKQNSETGNLGFSSSGRAKVLSTKECFQKRVMDDSLVRGCVDPVVEVLRNEHCSQEIGDLDRGRFEVLFPEVSDCLGLIDKESCKEVHLACEEATPVVVETESRVKNSTMVVTDLGNKSIDDVYEYSGPWAPGYFKRPGSQVNRRSVMLQDDPMRDKVNSGRGSQSIEDMSVKSRERSNQSSCNEQSLEVHLQGPIADVSYKSDAVEDYPVCYDPSLPPGFAGVIPPDIIENAKLKKKKEAKVKIGKAKVKNGKNGSESVTSALKNNGKSRIANPIKVEGVLDFALLMGLNIEGKETETKRNIAKILQDEQLEWENYKLEKQRGESLKD